MPVKKIYTVEEVKAAIDRSDNNFYRKFLRVRDDVSSAAFGTARIRVARTAGGDPIDPYAWRGRGSDVGHAFRHVAPSAPVGKSIYKDEATAVAVTRELLNSVKGQATLSALDQANPTGDELGMEENRKIVAPVTGVHYGASGQGQPWKKIRTAVCEVMKLGDSTLWIHTTYPNSFDA